MSFKKRNKKKNKGCPVFVQFIPIGMNNNVLNKALKCKLAIRSSLCQLYEFITQNIFETFFLVNQQFTITGKGGLAGHLNPNPKHKSLRYSNSESLWIPWATNSHFSKTRGLSYFCTTNISADNSNRLFELLKVTCSQLHTFRQHVSNSIVECLCWFCNQQTFHFALVFQQTTGTGSHREWRGWDSNVLRFNI